MSSQHHLGRKITGRRKGQRIVAGDVCVDDIERALFYEPAQPPDGSEIECITKRKFHVGIHRTSWPSCDDNVVSPLAQGLRQFDNVGFAATQLDGRTNLKNAHRGRQSLREVQQV